MLYLNGVQVGSLTVNGVGLTSVTVVDSTGNTVVWTAGANIPVAIIQDSYTKPNIATLPTDGLEKMKVPQTYPLIQGTGVVDNGDGTFQFVSSSKYDSCNFALRVDQVLSTRVVAGKAYRLIVDFELISGHIQIFQNGGTKFKETIDYTIPSVYQYAEIYDVTGINPPVYFYNYATSGTTTEIKVTGLSLQELNPQVEAFKDTGWIPPFDQDFSFSLLLNVTRYIGEVNFNGLIEEGTGHLVGIGQSSFDEQFKIQGACASANAYQYINSEMLGVGKHNAVVTYNATTKNINMFISGKLQGSDTSNYTAQSLRSFFLGHVNGTTGTYYNSPIYDFQAFDKELTLQEANDVTIQLGYTILSMAGDSTFTGQLGWYKMLQPHLPNKDNLIVMNTAKGGATAKSFYTDGHWTAVLNTKPKYIFLGFGQNDWTGGVDIDLEFKPNINTMLDEAIANGITPYLFTPTVSTSTVDGSVVSPNNDAYGDAIKVIGTTRSIPVVDLTAKSRTYFTSIGGTATKALHSDSVHFNIDGADAISTLVREELDRLGIALI